MVMVMMMRMLLRLTHRVHSVLIERFPTKHNHLICCRFIVNIEVRVAQGTIKQWLRS